jgi:hypothetical protein
MRPAAGAFLGILAAAAAAWGALVLPLDREACSLAARIEEGQRKAPPGDPPPAAEEVRRIDEALAALRPGPGGPAPKGLSEERPGVLSGRIPWEEVQQVLAWAAAQPLPVLEIDVRALPEEPSRAACRVSFAGRGPR